MGNAGDRGRTCLTAPALCFVGALAADLSAHGGVCCSPNAQGTPSGALTSLAGGVGVTMHAWRFVPARTLFVDAALLMTGSPLRDDFMGLEVWSDASGSPGVVLGRGSMAVPRGSVASWRGTNFARTLQLVRDTPYWFVWAEAGDSLSPDVPGGTALPYRRLDSALGWVDLGASACKFSLFCGDTLDSVEVQRVGFSCVASTGDGPVTWSNEWPAAGNGAFAVESVHLPAGAPSWLLLGFDPSFALLRLDQLLGAPFACALYTSPAVVFSETVGTASIGTSPAVPRPQPSGHVRYPLPIPADPTLAGIVFVVQVAAVDSAAAAALPVITTNALHVTIQ